MEKSKTGIRMCTRKKRIRTEGVKNRNVKIKGKVEQEHKRKKTDKKIMTRVRTEPKINSRFEKDK
jgi:hypothetical protein